MTDWERHRSRFVTGRASENSSALALADPSSGGPARRADMPQDEILKYSTARSEPQPKERGCVVLDQPQLLRQAEDARSNAPPCLAEVLVKIVAAKE